MQANSDVIILSLLVAVLAVWMFCLANRGESCSGGLSPQQAPIDQIAQLIRGLREDPDYDGADDDASDVSVDDASDVSVDDASDASLNGTGPFGAGPVPGMGDDRFAPPADLNDQVGDEVSDLRPFSAPREEEPRQVGFMDMSSVKPKSQQMSDYQEAMAAQRQFEKDAADSRYDEDGSLMQRRSRGMTVGITGLIDDVCGGPSEPLDAGRIELYLPSGTPLTEHIEDEGERIHDAINELYSDDDDF